MQADRIRNGESRTMHAGQIQRRLLTLCAHSEDSRRKEKRKPLPSAVAWLYSCWFWICMCTLAALVWLSFPSGETRRQGT